MFRKKKCMIMAEITNELRYNVIKRVYFVIQHIIFIDSGCYISTQIPKKPLLPFPNA